MMVRLIWVSLSPLVLICMLMLNVTYLTVLDRLAYVVDLPVFPLPPAGHSSVRIVVPFVGYALTPPAAAGTSFTVRR